MTAPGGDGPGPVGGRGRPGGATPRGRTRSARRGPMLPGDGPLARVPAWVAFVVVIALFGAGVLVGGTVGALLLGVLAVGVALLLAATWPRLTSGERFARCLVLAVLIAIALSMVLR